MFILIAGGLWVRRFQNQRLYIMAISDIISFVGVLVLSLLENNQANKWIKWAMFDITAFFSLALFLSWSLSTMPPQPELF
jgi:MFS transporter, ACS family, allantoate permease